MHIIQKRFLFTSQFTGGVYCTDGDRPIVLTADRPMTGDHPAIPAGLYHCHLQEHCSYDDDGKLKCYPAFQIDSVPFRPDIEIHILNAPCRIMKNGEPESKGCTGTGLQFGIIDGYDGVLHSVEAFKIFMAFMKNENVKNFDLTIVDLGHKG
jgi:hypothetical protein